jgi:hypothetical protein
VALTGLNSAGNYKEFKLPECYTNVKFMDGGWKGWLDAGSQKAQKD